MESVVKKLKQNLRSGSSSREKSDRNTKKETRFLENGSKFIKELIADCNGISIPIRSFSSSQILKATKNFDSGCLVRREWDHKGYKATIEDKSYLIKRYFEYKVMDRRIGESYKDIVLSARMSNHSNFLKLFGCCLEFRVPIFVFEYAENGYLNERGSVMVNGEESVLPWSLRLKIGKEIANAVTYLHMAFPKVIIHRDINPTNIFLDKNFNAKLSDLSYAISLPEGKSRIETDSVMGRAGYLDPLYLATNLVTEYTDVYSFGVFLMVILTGRSAFISTRSDGNPQHIRSYVKGLFENGKLDEVIDPMMVKEITNDQRLQVEACVVLALRCYEERYEDRPKMIQVAKELKRIQTSLRDSSYRSPVSSILQELLLH